MNWTETGYLINEYLYNPWKLVNENLDWTSELVIVMVIFVHAHFPYCSCLWFSILTCTSALSSLHITVSPAWILKKNMNTLVRPIVHVAHSSVPIAAAFPSICHHWLRDLGDTFPPLYHVLMDRLCRNFFFFAVQYSGWSLSLLNCC